MFLREFPKHPTQSNHWKYLITLKSGFYELKLDFSPITLYCLMYDFTYPGLICDIDTLFSTQHAKKSTGRNLPHREFPSLLESHISGLKILFRPPWFTSFSQKTQCCSWFEKLTNPGRIDFSRANSHRTPLSGYLMEFCMLGTTLHTTHQNLHQNFIGEIDISFTMMIWHVAIHLYHCNYSRYYYFDRIIFVTYHK